MQTDINPNFGVTNTNKVTAWHRINIVSYLIMHRIHWFLSPLLTQTRLSSSLMLLTQASQWLSYISSIFKSNRKRFPCLHSLKKTQEGLGEFKTVTQTQDKVEGLHNCLKISQSL